MLKESNQREQQLFSVSEKILTELWKRRLELIKKEYEVNSLFYDGVLIKKMDKLLQQWESIYGATEQELKYIIISPLSSSVITRTYEFQVALFGKDLYADENPLCFYWVPEFIYKDVEEDIALYKEQASREIIRLREDEVYEIRRRYTLCHAYITMFFVDKVMKKIVQSPYFKRIGMADTKILYGTYMEQMVEIGGNNEI